MLGLVTVVGRWGDVSGREEGQRFGTTLSARYESARLSWIYLTLIGRDEFIGSCGVGWKARRMWLRIRSKLGARGGLMIYGKV